MFRERNFTLRFSQRPILAARAYIVSTARCTARRAEIQSKSNNFGRFLRALREKKNGFTATRLAPLGHRLSRNLERANSSALRKGFLVVETKIRRTGPSTTSPIQCTNNRVYRIFVPTAKFSSQCVVKQTHHADSPD